MAGQTIQRKGLIAGLIALNVAAALWLVVVAGSGMTGNTSWLNTFITASPTEVTVQQSTAAASKAGNSCLPSYLCADALSDLGTVGQDLGGDGPEAQGESDPPSASLSAGSDGAEINVLGQYISH